MSVSVLRFAILLLGLFPVWAIAQPVTLKFSFFTSDRSDIYQCSIKPFVDSVNADGEGHVHIKVYFSGAISPVQQAQPQLVLDGAADLATVAPGNLPVRFLDTSVMELPGLFRNEFEASEIFTRLAQTGALAGYKDFFVVGAFASAGESIHSRKPITSLADLKGQRIRVNNQIEAQTLRKLGAVPLLLPINQTMEELSRGALDGVTVPPSLLFEFGFGRLASHHYLIHLGIVPSTILMNRDKLASLPQRTQEIIRKYSGAWFSSRAAECFAEKNREVVARLKGDHRRSVVEPSPADRAAIERVFASVVEDWAAQSPRHREILTLVKAEIARLRSKGAAK